MDKAGAVDPPTKNLLHKRLEVIDFLSCSGNVESEMLIFLHNSHESSMLSSQGKVTMSSSVEMHNNQVRVTS